MKKIKIIIPVLVAILIVLCVLLYIILGNKIAITGKGKVQKGLAKSFSFFEENESGLTDFEEYKYMKYIDSKPFETEMKFNVDVDFEGLEEYDRDFAKAVKKVTEEIADSDITLKLAMDKKNKQMVCGLDLDAEEIVGKLTGEAVITDEEIAFRSEDINEKFLKITKEDAEDNGMDEIFDFVDELFEKNFNNLSFSKEEIKHFKDTYSVVLENTITNEMINSEKGEFVVNGENTKCTVTTVKFDNEKVKELLKNYINVYKEDKEGKEILKKKFSAIYGEKKSEDFFESLDDELDEIEDFFDKIEDTSLEFITYGTSTEVYGNEYKITMDEETLAIVEKFNSDNITYVGYFEDEEVLNATIKKGEFCFEATVTSLGSTLNVNFAKTKEKVEFSMKSDEYEISVKADIKVKTNTDEEFAQDVVLNIERNVPDENFTQTINAKINQTLKIVDSIDVPNINKAINIFDEDKLEEYADDSMDAIQKLSDKFKKSDFYKAIFDYSLTSRNRGVLARGRQSAKYIKKNMIKEDLEYAVLSCDTDYQMDRAMDQNVKKEDYLNKEYLNYYVNRGKVTKYDFETGKGTYEPNDEELEVFDFTIKDWNLTIEDESYYFDKDDDYGYYYEDEDDDYDKYNYNEDDDYTTESDDIVTRAQNSAKRTKISGCVEDLNMAVIYGCKEKYLDAKELDKKAKIEDYLNKEKINKSLNKGEIIEYDSRTGKGIYKPKDKEINEFEFSISLDDWNITVEDY